MDEVVQRCICLSYTQHKISYIGLYTVLVSEVSVLSKCGYCHEMSCLSRSLTFDTMQSLFSGLESLCSSPCAEHYSVTYRESVR